MSCSIQTRRQCIRWIFGCTLGAVLVRCSSDNNPESSDPTATVSTDSNNVAKLDFETFPNLKTVNGTYRVNIRATSGTKLVSVTRVRSDLAVTVSATCTHSGCTIGGFNASTGQYSCPCHGSGYNSSGAVVQGPATVALTTYTTQITSTSVDVTVL